MCGTDAELTGFGFDLAWFSVAANTAAACVELGLLQGMDVTDSCVRQGMGVSLGVCPACARGGARAGCAVADAWFSMFPVDGCPALRGVCRFSGVEHLGSSNLSKGWHDAFST